MILLMLIPAFLATGFKSVPTKIIADITDKLV